MIQIGSIRSNLGRGFQEWIDAARIEYNGGPSRTETKHLQPRFGQVGTDCPLGSLLSIHTILNVGASQGNPEKGL